MNMQRYYFHVRDGDDFLVDSERLDFATLAEVHREAIQSARDMLADLLRAGKALDGQLIEITDEQGTILEIVRFRDALTPDGTIH
jgi:hypothetical protein